MMISAANIICQYLNETDHYSRKYLNKLLLKIKFLKKKILTKGKRNANKIIIDI